MRVNVLRMASCVKCFRSKKERSSCCSNIENRGSRLYRVTSSGHIHFFGRGTTASFVELIVHPPSPRWCEPLFARARHESAPSLELIDPPNRVQTVECRVKLFVDCDAPQKGQSHANPNRSSPDQLNRGGERYEWKTEGGPHGPQSVERPLTTSTGLADWRSCAAIRTGTGDRAAGRAFFDE